MKTFTYLESFAGRFNDFEPLTLEMKALYNRYIDSFPVALPSTLYFQGLYAWNFASINRYKILDGHLCIAVLDMLAKDIFALPPLGELNCRSFASAVRAVLNEFEREGLPCVFREVPGFMLPYFSAVEGYRAEVNYDRNCSEYVYALDDLAEGIQSSDFRRARNNFERKYQPHAREITQSDKDTLRAVTQKFFCTEMACSDCFYGCELEVASRIVEGWEELGMKGIIVEIEGQAQAFGIVCFQKDTVFFISKKIHRKMKGLDSYLTTVMTNNLFDVEHRYLNYSDDLGSDGLRAYKSSLAKHTLMHRYAVRLLRT